MKKISLLVPCYNEQDTLQLFHEAVSLLIMTTLAGKYDWEFLFVNDGSSDNTLDILKELRKKDSRVNYLNLSRNFGKERAMLAGLDYVTGDCCIIMDADLQDPPELIADMLGYWEQGYDDVYAKRKSRGEESFMRRRLTMLFYWLLQKSSNIDILPNVGDFRLLDRRCVLALRRLRESERYTKGLFCWIGFNKKEVLFDRGNRVSGKSSWNFLSLLNLAVEGITTFTVAPLRFVTFAGLASILITVVYSLYFFVKTLVWGDPTAGFPTLIIVILLLGGLQLLGLGIIGEYIARIFRETKNRPVYIASDYNEQRLGC